MCRSTLCADSADQTAPEAARGIDVGLCTWTIVSDFRIYANEVAENRWPLRPWTVSRPLLTLSAINNHEHVNAECRRDLWRGASGYR